ncbi:MAG TPA: sugar phosphate isomerase/epimerase family protein [Pirellulaceae bacterium]|nr:sugar phosphate isomerase/epimerase family protein [Pirellulaceae bacterium]
MALFSMNELTTYRWSFEDDVHRYADAGIRSIGVWRQKLSDFGEEKGIELLSEVGLRASNLMWAGGFTGSDGRSYNDALADARDAIRLTADLQADCLIVYSGSRGGHTTNHASRLLNDALKALMPVAMEFEVTLAIKPMDAGCANDWTFLTELAETVDLLEEFDSPVIKLAFDTYHFGLDPTAIERLADIVPRIAIVQLGDAKQRPTGEQNRCRLGEGAVPFAEIFSKLADGGYRGSYDVKLLGEDVEPFDYDDLLAHSKQKFESWQISAPS